MTEQQLAESILALTESLSMSLRAQAETNRIFAKKFPEIAEPLTTVANGLEDSASNLTKHLPERSTDQTK